MKGRIECPECKHEFVLDIPADGKKHEAVCPKCKKKFIIRTKCSPKESEDGCYWEEYGEPRKTILSSIKPKTNRPKIAAIILVCVFALGLTTAAFSDMFIESSLDVASSFGMTGTVEIHVTNQTNKSIENIQVNIEGVDSVKKTGNGSYLAENVEVGIREITITSLEYSNLTQEILVTPFFKSYHKIKMKKGIDNEKNYFDTTSCSIILMIFSVFALLGAVASLKREHFDVAVAGSIISIFSFGFFMIGSILSVIAFIIVMKSKEEFEDGKKGKVF